MTDVKPQHGPALHWLIFVVILAASMLPLLFLNLDEASQLAGALALPLSVLLVALTTVPAVRASNRPFPWRRVLVIGSVVVAVVGGSGVAYAFWQNTRDLPVELSTTGSQPGHWTDGSSILLSVPGAPPERGHLTLVVSLRNVNSTGNCERTATLDFTPVLDDQQKSPISRQMPGREVELSLVGAVRSAKVLVALHYDEGNKRCEIDLYVDKAVLH
jgi:hypothetical protein